MLFQCAPLPQLDRGTDYESVRRGFESLTAHHLAFKTAQLGGFFLHLFQNRSRGVIGRSSAPLSRQRWSLPAHRLVRRQQGSRHRPKTPYSSNPAAHFKCGYDQPSNLPTYTNKKTRTDARPMRYDTYQLRWQCASMAACPYANAIRRFG